MIEFKNISLYNDLWEKGIITEPVVICIGGYAGTGKSTVAAAIQQHLNYTNLLPTGIIRSVEQKFTNRTHTPSMFEHTYNLYKLCSDENSEQEIWTKFLEQAEPISATINIVLKFISTEKQHFILDGNHILPNRIKDRNDLIYLEVYNQVSEPEAHRIMLGGASHNRTLNQKQFETARILHSKIIEEVRQKNGYLFEFSESPFEVLQLLENKIEDYLTSKQYI